MDKIQIILLALVGFILLLDIIATVFVSRSESFDRKQKIIQIILLWIVPIVGAVTAIYFAKEPSKSKPDYQTTDSVARHDIHYGGGGGS